MVIGIEGLAPPSGRRAAAGKPAGKGFALTVRNGRQALAAPEAGASPSLASVLAVQEQAEAEARDRRAAAGAGILLQALTGLQHGVLSGDPASGLGGLEAALAALPEPSDLRLAALLQAVRTRARVEIARWESIAQGRK